MSDQFNEEEQNMEQSRTEGQSGMSRRDFVKMTGTVSLAVATAGLSTSSRLFAANVAGTDTIRVGLIGCGGRGAGAAGDCINAAEGVELAAMGDLFEDRLRGSLNNLQGGLPAEKFKVTDDTAFWGFDAFEKVIATDCNYVILATPPGFRPQHLKAAIEAGKHVFMEKPVAVDPVGVRWVMICADLAAQKGLGIVTGTQRRHQASYIETIKRIHEGALGEIVAAQCYWNQGGLWAVQKQEGWSDMEWQVRNWLYFTWLSGDHIVEQHVHNLDVINWVLQAHPVKALGLGGRQARTDPVFGHIYDHFAIDYEFPNGVHVMSTCRQIDGTAGRVSENVVGTQGKANPGGSIRGETPFRYEGPNPNPYVQEHADLIASIRAGQPLNEGRQIAESTLTAIMGRMSAYTGQEVTWEWAMNESQLDLSPPKYEMGDLPVPPVAIPGQTPLV
jgi:predicted dehydrogenase